MAAYPQGVHHVLRKDHEKPGLSDRFSRDMRTTKWRYADNSGMSPAPRYLRTGYSSMKSVGCAIIFSGSPIPHCGICRQCPSNKRWAAREHWK